MNELAGFTLLVLGFAVVAIPAAATWRRGRINGQFPWIFTASAFLVLNAVGAFSPNVLDGLHSTTFYLLMLATSIALALAFALCDRIGEEYVKSLQILNIARGEMRDGAGLRVSFVALMLCSFASVLLFAIKVSPPLLFRFDLYGDWESLIATRIAIVKASNFDWFALGFFELPLFMVILSGIMAHVTSQIRSPSATFWRRARLVGLIYALLTAVMFLHRHYVVYVLVAAFLISIWARGLNLARVALFVAICASTIFLLYAAYGGTQVADTLVHTMWHRVFEVYPWAAAEVSDVFTREQAFLNGRSMINLFGAFPFEQVDLAAQVYPRIYGNLGIGTALGSAPVPAVFESFANFGWAGAILTLIVLMAALICLQILWRAESPWLVALSMFLTIKLALFWQSPLWFGFLEPSLVLLIGAIALWYVVALFGGRTTRSGT